MQAFVRIPVRGIVSQLNTQSHLVVRRRGNEFLIEKPPTMPFAMAAICPVGVERTLVVPR